MAKFDDCEFPSCLGTLVYLINSGFVFVVCVSRTIFGKKIKVHVHLASWKHGNRVTGLTWCVRSSGCYGCYGAMPRTCS